MHVNGLRIFLKKIWDKSADHSVVSVQMVFAAV